MKNKTYDLNDPKQCREFLKSLEINDVKITHLYTESGNKLSIDEASDFQVIQIANDLAEGIEAKGNQA